MQDFDEENDGGKEAETRAYGGYTSLLLKLAKQRFESQISQPANAE
jgi:hypothetical protein